MPWHIYDIAPIDFGWENLKTVRETASVFLERGSLSSSRINDIDTSDLEDFLRYWKSAKDAASTKGWEGDFRNEPVVMWIPNDSEFKCGFAFKQDSNGTTFVISPVEMPWLEDQNKQNGQ